MTNTNDYRKMNPQERVERARNDSVKTRNLDIVDVNYRGDRFKLSAHKLKVAVVTTFLATAITATGVGIGLGIAGVKAVDNFKENIAISDTLEEYDSIVSENTYRTKDNQGYWHDSRKIAMEILDAEDQDLAIYAVYNNISFNRTKNMSDIFHDLSIFTKYSGDPSSHTKIYSSYEDYLKEMGCIDNEGNISTKMYEEKMDEYASVVADMKKAESNMKR